MSTRNLDKLMAPKSVVAIGASERPGSVGAAVTHNLLAGGFKGDIHFVNRKGGTIAVSFTNEAELQRIYEFLTEKK